MSLQSNHIYIYIYILAVSDKMIKSQASLSPCLSPIDGFAERFYPTKKTTSRRTSSFVGFRLKNLEKESSRRRVHFDRNVKVQRIQHRNELEESGLIQDTCLSGEDYKTIRGDTRLVLKEVVNQTKEPTKEPNNYCTRGLEERIYRTNKQKTSPKKEGVLRLLAEQDVQRQQGSVSPQLLAEFSAMYSLECVKAAMSLALEDAKEASEYLQSESEESEEFEDIIL